MIQRALQASFFETDLYEKVEHDAKYTFEAGLIVVITSILGGLGSWLSGDGFGGFITITIIGLIGWAVWSGVTLFVGVNVFGGTADYGQMLRVIGYANAPLALGIIPFVGLFIGSIWALLASIVAIRHGLDFGYIKAILTAIVGWAIVRVTISVLNFIF